ncbi:MAG: DUF2301 domain-containing membrane protein [Spirulinaceae cyanobacterium RM2_2_10]|nr:DUF2301 domain-containing membrane protein [Spirulinaceae cyanobacterium SM2_1_0]NJO21028.1 DUF2301 domain-containing membrane protein [Spirulinaceae cyanobacterium RM2_2_10]
MVAPNVTAAATETVVYQGQFGEFTIEVGDRRSVVIYRAGLALSALSFALGTTLFLWRGNDVVILHSLTILYALFSLGLGISLLTIHIYLRPLHRLLQLFWLVGTVAATSFAWHGAPQPLAQIVYTQPLTILGIGFTFAALTGICFKEAFCFNRLETKLLTPLLPALLLGHLTSALPLLVERGLLVAGSILLMIFASRKAIQAIPPDIGDKSVFAYLAVQAQMSD